MHYRMLPLQRQQQQQHGSLRACTLQSVWALCIVHCAAAPQAHVSASVPLVYDGLSSGWGLVLHVCCLTRQLCVVV